VNGESNAESFRGVAAREERNQRLAPWEANTHAQYIGANEDPRLRGTRPDLRGAVTVPYEDFLTGFVADTNSVWGRPVGVTVMRDGSLLVTEDGNNTIWRVSHRR